MSFGTTLPAIIGGLGIWELILILVIVLVIFGAGKLPQLGESLGKGIRNFRNASKGDGEDNAVDGEPAKAELPEKTATSAEKVGTEVEARDVTPEK